MIGFFIPIKVSASPQNIDQKKQEELEKLPALERESQKIQQKIDEHAKVYKEAKELVDAKEQELTTLQEEITTKSNEIIISEKNIKERESRISHLAIRFVVIHLSH